MRLFLYHVSVSHYINNIFLHVKPAIKYTHVQCSKERIPVFSFFGVCVLEKRGWMEGMQDHGGRGAGVIYQTILF